MRQTDSACHNPVSASLGTTRTSLRFASLWWSKNVGVRKRQKLKYIICCIALLFSFASQAQEGDPFYSNTNPYFKTGNVGECTWYVWGRVYANDRIPLPHWGDAGAWFGSASTSGYQTGSTPKPHSVAVWVGGKGHVAYIERIEGGLVYFSLEFQRSS